MNDGARENQSLIPCEWNQALVLYARRVLRDIFSQWRVGDVWGRTTGMRWEKNGSELRVFLWPVCFIQSFCVILHITSNPQPIGFRGILLVKRQKFILLYIFLAQQKCRRHKIPLPHKAT